MVGYILLTVPIVIALLMFYEAYRNLNTNVDSSNFLIGGVFMLMMSGVVYAVAFLGKRDLMSLLFINIFDFLLFYFLTKFNFYVNIYL